MKLIAQKGVKDLTFVTLSYADSINQMPAFVPGRGMVYVFWVPYPPDPKPILPDIQRFSAAELIGEINERFGGFG